MGNQSGKEKEDKLDTLSREQLDDLNKRTHFSQNEIMDIFKRFKKEAPQGVISKSEFKMVLQRMGVDDSFLQDLICKVFDGTRSGSISFPEFLYALSTITRGTPDEKLEFAFSMYDLDDKGYITRSDMAKIMTSFCELVGDVVTFSGKKFESVDQLVDAFFEQMDTTGDGKITIEEYKESAIRNPDIVIGLGLGNDDSSEGVSMY